MCQNSNVYLQKHTFNVKGDAVWKSVKSVVGEWMFGKCSRSFGNTISESSKPHEESFSLRGRQRRWQQQQEVQVLPARPQPEEDVNTQIKFHFNPSDSSQDISLKTTNVKPHGGARGAVRGPLNVSRVSSSWKHECLDPISR